MKRRTMKWAIVALSFIGVGLIGYLFHVAGQIQKQSTVDDSRPADVIIVLGAAEYRGRKSGDERLCFGQPRQ